MIMSLTHVEGWTIKVVVRKAKSMTPTQEILQDIVRKLEATALTVAAIETALKTEEYAGRQLTKEQINALADDARSEMQIAFSDLKLKIRDLP
jgi:hypothetical protein